MRRLVGASLVRGSAAILAALLLSSAALAAPRTEPKASCCAPQGMSEDGPSCCCMSDGPSDSFAGCCRVSAPEEAAPALTSPAAPVLTAPAAAAVDLPLPALPRFEQKNAGRFSQLARAGPLHLLYSTLLV